MILRINLRKQEVKTRSFKQPLIIFFPCASEGLGEKVSLGLINSQRMTFSSHWLLNQHLFFLLLLVTAPRCTSFMNCLSLRHLIAHWLRFHAQINRAMLKINLSRLMRLLSSLHFTCECESLLPNTRGQCESVQCLHQITANLFFCCTETDWSLKQSSCNVSIGFPQQTDTFYCRLVTSTQPMYSCKWSA